MFIANNTLLTVYQLGCPTVSKPVDAVESSVVTGANFIRISGEADKGYSPMGKKSGG